MALKNLYFGDELLVKILKQKSEIDLETQTELIKFFSDLQISEDFNLDLLINDINEPCMLSFYRKNSFQLF